MNNDKLRVEVKLLKAKGIIDNYYEVAELMEVSNKSFYNWLCGCYNLGYTKQERLQSIINDLYI